MSDKFRRLRRVVYPAVFSALFVILHTPGVKAQTFSTPQELSNPVSNSSYPSIFVDSAGSIDIAWVDSVSGINFRRATTSTTSGLSFSAPITIAGSVGAAFQPQMVVNSTATIVEIAWVKPSTAAGASAGSYDVFVTQLNLSTLTPVTTPIVTAAVLADSPRLAFDGTAVDVVWGNTETWISQSAADGVTFASAPIKLSIAAQDSGGPRIAVDKSGNVFVAWTDRLAETQNQSGNYCTQPSGTTNSGGVVTIYNNSSGGNYYFNWTKAGTSPNAANTRSLSNTDWKNVHTDVSYPNGYYGCSYDNLQLFFDQNNNLHLLWADEAPIEDLLTSTATTPLAANGSPTFSFPIGTSGDEGAGAPNVTTDSNGNFYIVYAAGPKAPADTEGIYFNRSDNDGASFALPESAVISPPGAISPAYPQVVVDSSGNVNVVWEQADQPITASGGNTFHLFFARSKDRGNTFPTIRPVQPATSANASVLCIPATPSGGAPPTTPDKTTCGTVQMALDTNSTTNLNPNIAWVNNPGSSANIDVSVANVAATPPQDFSISINPGTPTAYSGETVTFTVTAQAVGSFSSPITLGCNDFPAIAASHGGTVRRSDFVCTASGLLNPGGSATVNLSIPAQLPAGTYPFAINGTSGGTTHRVMVNFSTTGPAGSVTPVSATIATGASANFNVTINPGPFTGNVNFLCAGQPSWIQCAFNPPSVTASSTASSSSVLTVTVVSKPTASSLRYPQFSLFALRALMFAGLCVASLLLLMIAASRRGKRSAQILLRGIAVVALVLALSIGLTSCAGASGPSAAANANNGAAGNTGSNIPVTVNFNVQAQSGTATATLGALTITAQ
ncbi:MAG TPA: hypothetical protein VFA85_01490 [Terriglobales bacterium]|jgi:hypothetical protein|nr:hypothetical protein [Terriglobales bacterium]